VWLSPLRVAAMKGHLDIVKLLLEQGAIVDASGQTGRTALHWAALKGHRDILKLLLEYDAGIDVQDELVRTPLDWALMRGHRQAAKLLQEHITSKRKQVTSRGVKRQ
jgi:ankyrin repeat protein